MIDADLLRIHLVQEIPLASDQETFELANPERYVTLREYDIILEGGSGGLTRVGELSLVTVDLDRWSREGGVCAVFELFDVLDAATFEIAEALFTNSGRLRRRVIANPISINVVLLDRLRVSDEYRNKGIGSSVVRRVLEEFGEGATLIALLAWPIDAQEEVLERHTGSNHTDSTDAPLQEYKYNTPAFRQAAQRVRAFYEKHGFRTVGGNRVMYWSTAMLAGTTPRCLKLV